MRRMLLALLVGVPAVVTVGAAIESPVVSALPLGFDDSVVASVSRPTAVESLLDGRVAVLEKNSGRVRIIDSDSGSLLATPALDLSVCSDGERGLLGFTSDPHFAQTGRVYVFYTRLAPGWPGGCVNRVSAFTMSGNTINPASEQVLIDNISSVAGNHNAGDIEIGNDGFLYVATGDAGSNPRGGGGTNVAAQDLSLLNGKILRLDRFSGAPAPGNPLSGAGTVACGSRGNTSATAATSCRELFAWGLRNPYRFAFDPNTSATRFFINDVGQSSLEEVDNGLFGANYGWPDREGNCPRGSSTPCAGPSAGQIDPITSYGRSLGQFITAGAFIPDGIWPSQYDGAYLFADGGSGRMWMRSAAGAVDYGSTFASGLFGITDMTFVMERAGPALYYTRDGSNVVRKITYDLPSATPVGLAVYVPLATPEREFDSRMQSPPAPIRGGQTRVIDLDAPAGATSALVNITMVVPSGEVYATAWEPRTSRPFTSNVNASNGEVVGNSSVVPLDSSGRILLYLRTTSDVVIDVSGFFHPSPGAATAGRYVGLDPLRLIDMRNPVGPTNDFTTLISVGDPGPGGPSDIARISLPVAGRVGVPATGVSAVAMIATGLVDGAQSGWVRVNPSGMPAVTASLNTNPGVDHRNNLVVVPLGPDGKVEVDLFRTDDVVLDVVGWFTDGLQPSSAAGRFQLIQPVREVDTRIPLGFGPLGDGASAPLDPISVPATATAVAQNFTVAPSSAGGYVTAFPGGAVPLVANLNTTAGGQVRGAAAFTTLSAGSETIFSFRATQLVIDIFGYFT